MPELTSEATIDVVDTSDVVVELDLVVLPTLPLGEGRGKLVHPTLGAFDYTHKPDEWTNMDDDVTLVPVWNRTQTMGGSVSVVWDGYVDDVMATEEWKSYGGLAMPISQLRMLKMLWQNPIDPAIGYLLWYPSYANENCYAVALFDISTGSGITLNDIVNAKDIDGNNDGWVTNPVKLTFKIFAKVSNG